MKIGYARKSTKEQDTSLEYQIEALQKAGCEKWYAEQVSRGGKRLKKGTPELENCLKALRAGTGCMGARPIRRHSSCSSCSS
jgi:DNA invertase Pin-like site-specific DNA recombinase